MVYIRVKPRVTAAVGDAVTLGDLADLFADASLRLKETPISLPRRVGIWRLAAPQLVAYIEKSAPGETVRVLGDGTGWLCLEPRRGRVVLGWRKRWRAGRAGAAAILLIAVCAMTLLPFRGGADVAAYALGVLLGLAGYCYLAARGKAAGFAARPGVAGAEAGKDARREGGRP